MNRMRIRTQAGFIINFDNVYGIEYELKDFEEAGEWWVVSAVSMRNKSTAIGLYKTEAEAKKVVGEIYWCKTDYVAPGKMPEKIMEEVRRSGKNR